MRALLLVLIAAGCSQADLAVSEPPSNPGGNSGGDLSTDAAAASGAPGPMNVPPRSGGGFVDAGYRYRDGGASDPSTSSGGGSSPTSSADAAAPPGPTPPPSSPPPQACTVSLRPLSAPSLAGLVAGPMATAVVRAEIRGVTGPLVWSWQVTYLDANEPLTVTADPADPAVVEFPVARPGQYLLTAATAVGGAPCASGPVYAAAASPLQLRNVFLVRAIPPTAARVPVQHQVLEVAGGAPVVDEMRLGPGTMVTIEPRDQSGASAIPAYVRVSDRDSPLVFEGYADAAPFGALLPGGVRYDVLIVPVGEDRSVVGARYAPVWVANQTPDQIKLLPLRLTPGVAVRGRVATTGGALSDARIVLRGATTPSTVGRTGPDGAFEVLARADSFAFVASPPPGSGLPEVVAGPVPELAISEGAPAPEVTLVWNAQTYANGAVTVLGLDGRPVAQARVRVEATLPDAATVTVTRAGASATLSAPGSMRVEAVTGADGVARLGRLPAGTYQALVAPDPASPAAITSAPVVFGGGGATTVRLAAKIRLAGALLGEGDRSGVRITATDVGTDLEVPPLVTTSAADGSFALPLSARRRYLLLADPPGGSRFARTFVGAGPIEPSDFVLRQRLPLRLPFHGRVVGDAQRTGFADTLVKVFCFPGAPDCPDPTIPLAETITGSDGTFDMALPDPATR
jgi:hypothetical protein